MEESLEQQKTSEASRSEEKETSSEVSSKFPLSSLIGPWWPKSGNLTCTHIVYLVVILFVVTSASIFSMPGFRNMLENRHFPCYKGNTTDTCYVKTARLVTFRIGIGTADFFFLLVVLLVRVRHNSWRSGFHAGFWLPKSAILLLIGCGIYYVPHGIIDTIWGYQEIVVWFVFAVLQLVFLVDFSHAFSKSLAGQPTERKTPQNTQSYVLIKTCNVMLCISNICVVVALYSFYGFQDKCKTNTVLTTANISICAIAFFVSAMTSKNKGRIHLHRSIFQTNLVLGYVLYLTFSAVSHERKLCTPNTFNFFDKELRLGSYVHALTGALIMCMLLSYVFLRSRNQNHYTFYGMSLANQAEETNNTKDVVYNCSFVHVIFMLATMYSSATFVSPHHVDTVTMAAMSWTFLTVKSLTSVFVTFMYLWIVIAPTIYPEEDVRDFYVLLKSLFKFTLASLKAILFTGCPGLNQSKSTRFIYTIFFISGTIASCLMYLPSIRHPLESNPFFCKKISRLGNCMSHDPGYLAVYRICFSMATFYLLFAVILYAVKNYADPRALIHNGLWIVKFVLFFGLLIGTFFIPLGFSKVWTYICPLGTFFFTVIQMILIVDLTRTCNSSFVRKAEVTGKNIWFHLIVAMTAILYATSIVAVICFYIYFVGGAGNCKVNKAFITMNLVLCGVASVVSIHPVVTDSGLFQGGAVTFFTMYLTLSGLSYNPNEKCNPLASYVSEVDMRPSINIQAIIDLFLTLALLVYFSVRVVPLSRRLRELSLASFKLICGLREKATNQEDSDVENSQSDSDQLDESERTKKDVQPVPYSFSFYHFVYFLASLHITMVLTNWYTPKYGTQFKLYINWTAMCIKMSASSLCVLLYTWSLVVPVLLAKPAEKDNETS